MGQELMKSRYTDKSLMKAVDPNKEWCDRYEFAMAAFCGAAAGLVDAFLLGDVSNAKSESVLKSFSDERVEKVVMAYREQRSDILKRVANSCKAEDKMALVLLLWLLDEDYRKTMGGFWNGNKCAGNGCAENG